MIPLQERLNSGRYMIYDAAKGTLLASYVEPGVPTDILNLTNPKVVLQSANQYVGSGSELIQTNTFGASQHNLELHGLGSDIYDININGARIAKDAAGNKAYVAGSMGPSGLLLNTEVGNGASTFEEIVDCFKPQVMGLVDGGVDAIHIETMSSLGEVYAAIAAVKQINQAIPIIVTMTFSEKQPDNFRTDWGIKPSQLITVADEKGLLAYGANCGTGPDRADVLIKQLLGTGQGHRIVVAKLNAGIPRTVGANDNIYSSAEEMAIYALEMHKVGAKIIGACCGGTPRHIEAMANALAKR